MGSLRLSRATIIKLLVAGGAVGAAAVFVAAGVDLRAAADRYFALIREAGPTAFFGAMAVLPAFGCPMSLFTLTAGAAFGSIFSLVGVAASIAVNVSLTYWLARRWMRPWTEAFLARRGHRVPRIEREDAGEFALLVRLTPGPPFFLQSYLLGVAEVPFGRYFLISWVVGTAYGAGFVVFGESFSQGKVGLAIAGTCLMVAIFLATRLFRRRYAKRPT